MNRLIASFARNTVFANIVLVIVLLAGTLAAFSMVRETFPQFSLDMIQIMVPYPGADPEEVEEGICRKIEEAVESIEGIKEYTTSSREDVGSAFLEVHEDYELDDVLEQVRSQIDSISTFPVDAEKPIIREMLLRSEVVILGLSGNMSERRLKEWAENIKDEIQQLPEVSQVEIYGMREYEIAIEVSEERLREYGLTFAQVAAAVRQSNLNLAGGTIRTRGEEIRVRTMGRKYTGKELSSIVVLARPEGEIITLDRLARVRDGFAEDPIQLTIDGEQAALLVVLKTEEEDALAISKAVGQFVERTQDEVPEGANILLLFDISTMLRARINLLVRNGIIGLALIFFILWVFLDVRLSFWAGMGMPISVAGALAILWGMGETINMISLFGLIMVIGIVVDDAIVVGEAIFFHRKQGEPPIQAVVEGVKEVGMPVIAAVTTTIVAFLPLAYVGGVLGKFIHILPIVVIACLSISLVECLLLLPAHLSHLPDPNAEDGVRNPIARRINRFHQWTSRGLEWFVENIYGPFLKKTLAWRYISLSVTFCLLFITIGIIRGGILKFEVFPNIDGFIMTSTVEFPGGTPPEVTRDAVRQIEDALKRIADRIETPSGERLFKHHFSLVGSSLQQIPKIGPNVGSVQAVLLESEKRGIHTDDLLVRWEKEVGTVPGVVAMTFEGMGHGPPGAPIEIWLQGQDMDDILAAADDLQARLRQFEGVYQVRSDFIPGKNEMRLELKPEARAMGITVDDLARQVYAGYYGEEALRLQRGRDDVRVKVRYTEDERSRVSDLERVRIRTKPGPRGPSPLCGRGSLLPGILHDYAYQRVAPRQGQYRGRFAQGQHERGARRALGGLLRSTRSPASRTDRHCAGRQEEDEGDLRLPLRGIPAGHVRHVHDHRHDVPFLRTALCHPVHRSFRVHRGHVGARPARAQSFDDERLRHGGPGRCGGQRRHRHDRTNQREPCRGHAVLPGHTARRGPPFPSRLLDHRQHGRRTDAAHHGNGHAGTDRASHGDFPGSGRRLCHNAHPGPRSKHAGDSQ